MLKRGQLKKLAVIELVLLFLTAVAHFFADELLNSKGMFFLVAVPFWVCFVVWRVRKEPLIFRRWGFTVSGFRQSAFFSLIFAFIATIFVLFLGRSLGNSFNAGHLFLVALVYIIWAVVQLWLLLSLLFQDLEILFPSPKILKFALLPVFFGLTHLPDLPLSLLAGFVGLVWCVIYYRWRNIWPIAIAHAWLGALVYFMVLGRDPLIELFGLV